MARAQKLDFVFQRKGPVHSNRRGCKLSQAVAGEVCSSKLLHGSNAGQIVIFCLFRQFPLHFSSRASLCAIRFQFYYTKQHAQCCILEELTVTDRMWW
jgi:hypothetical protein